MASQILISPSLKQSLTAIESVHLFPNWWDKIVGPTDFGSRHCKNVCVGMNFGPSVGSTFGPFVGPTFQGSYSLKMLLLG